MHKNNKTCSICGQGYYYCKVCNDTKITPWKYITDTSEHYKIHEIIKGYRAGIYSKSEAKKKLQKIDLIGMESFLPEIQNVLNEILGNKGGVIMAEPIEDMVVGIADSINTNDVGVIGGRKSKTTKDLAIDTDVANEPVADTPITDNIMDGEEDAKQGKKKKK